MNRLLFTTRRLLTAGALAALGAANAQAQGGAIDPPATWDPAYWKHALSEIAAAQAQGNALQAEAWCARWVPYAEAQTVRALRAWAEFQDARSPRSGGPARLQAERLAGVLADRVRRPAVGSANLGFVPDDELRAYAQALRAAGHTDQAQAMGDLALAYRQGQAAYIQRSLLMRQGRDPRGECG